MWPFKRGLRLFVSPETTARLHATRSLIESTDVIEVVRRSCATFHLLVRLQAEGCVIVIRRPDGTESELQLEP